jgi:hypothetical protein
MATLALSVAGQFVGGAVGGPIGATIGRALGALAGAAIDSALFSEPQQQQAQGADTRLQGSAEGGPIPRLYGWSRLTGNIIWATELERIERASSGAKGAPKAAEEDEITANFAVALCEGEVHRLGRIWADGQLLETEGLTIRFYRGTADQLPDSLIEAKQGVGQAPAYRGLCYLVFERLPIGDFGNRVPNISVELCRAVGELEPAIRAVTVIPGATEFGYDPSPRVRLVGPGATANENTHAASQISDWTVSIDELQSLCPNLRHVSLVVAWFGDDLRCGSCSIRPKVEDATRAVDGAAWVVSGISRAEAQVVSSYAGGPAYGGTPSDGAVLAAIADLKARGIGVTLYPIVIMDVPADNSLADPYTGAIGQSAYPWRGRITCDPAPGRVGSPERTGAVLAQVDAFVGTAVAGEFTPAAGTVYYAGGGWGYRRMVLHYARLAQMAGGVDALLIGSEMRAMTTLRNAANGFPFVSALVALAADVRSIMGAGTKISYAADWSEFSGLQPGDAPGDKFFHLDPLWASADIDAVGIDNYMPLADWRDGTGHADAGVADGPHSLAYLQSNIAGGEGYDWFYTSDADRVAGVRSPILDIGHGEPWVWRFKDLVNWWSNAHHNRIGGVRSGAATAWLPQSKPIWLTELGCGAVDKGANAPNAFGDAKSAEDARPFFSTGAPDGLMQRQFLRAHLNWWGPEGEHNPASAVYAGRMLDPERIYLWTWDARPYPAFPSDLTAWSDGTNHATGHWLTGRLGAAATDELVGAIAADYGVDARVDALPPLIHGMRIEGVVTARDALAPVLAAGGLSIHDGPDGLRFTRAKERLAVTVTKDDLLDAGRALLTRRRPDPSEALGQVVLSYLDRGRGYLTGTVTATRLAGGTTSGEATNLVLDLAGARHAAERVLIDEGAARQTIEFSLPPSWAGLELGDAIAIEGAADGPFEITEIRDTDARRVSARAVPPMELASVASERPQAQTSAPPARAIPVAMAAHLPPDPADPSQSRLALAAFASPWPGEVTVTDELTGSTLTRLLRAAMLGELVEPIGIGQDAVWDNATALIVRLYAGHLSAKDDATVLAGGNTLAIESADGGWEIIGFGDASLQSPGIYRLTRLLRGLGGTRPAVALPGAKVMVLDDRVALLPVRAGNLGETMALRVYAGRQDLSGQPLAADLDLAPLMPLAPVHLGAARDPTSGDIVLTWIRRSRADANGWAMNQVPLDYQPEQYRITILEEGAVIRTLSSASSSVVYGANLQTADFGGPPANFIFTIAQMSPVFGAGAIAQGAFNG